jgi:hypothetical protein
MVTQTTQRIGLAALAAALLAASPALAGDESSIETRMKGSKAKGSVSLEMSSDDVSSEASLRLRAEKLPKKKNFVLEADGEDLMTVRSDKKGRLRRTYDLIDGELGPGFDPRGKRLSLRRDEREYLSCEMWGDDDESSSKVKESVDLTPTDAAGEGEAEARFERSEKGRTRFEVKLEDVPLGDYQVLVDGVAVGTITVVEEEDDDDHGEDYGDDDSPDDGYGEGKIRFSSDPKGSDLLLTFDPRGKTISVVPAGTEVVWFQAVMAASIPGVTECDEYETEIALVGVAPAEGEAELEIEDECKAELEVVAEGLAPGSYELRVAGVAQIVFEPSAEGRAKVELSSREEHDDDDGDHDGDDDGDDGDDDGDDDGEYGEHDDDDGEYEARLLADPRGALVEIVSLADGSVVLSGSFPQ